MPLFNLQNLLGFSEDVPRLPRQPAPVVDESFPAGAYEREGLLGKYWPSLLTAGLGILEQSGWQTMPVTTGQAIGRGGLLAMGPLLNIRKQIQDQRAAGAERGAYVFKGNGELDVEATTKNLAQIDPKLALDFSQQQQQYQLGMLNASLRNEDVQRKIAADTVKQQQAKKATAAQRGLGTYFAVLQGGGSEEQALAQAQQVYNAQAQAMRLPAEQFNPEDLQIDVETGQIMPGLQQVGDFQQVAKRGGEGYPPIMEPPQSEQPETVQPTPPVPANYNWQRAYLYSAMRLPKFNPQTSPIVLDYRTGAVMENQPVTRVQERRARAGAGTVQVGLGKTMPKAITESLEGSFTAAQGAIDSQNTVNRITDTLNNPKLIAGYGAGVRLSATQALNFLTGGSSDAEALANTRSLIQGLSELTLSSRSMLKGQGQVSDKETALLEKARGGDFSMTIPELKSLMAVFSRMNKAQYDKHQSALNRAKRLPGVEESGIDFFIPDPFPGTKGETYSPRPKSTPKAGGAIDFNELK